MSHTTRRPSIRIVALTLAAFALAGCQPLDAPQGMSTTPEAELEAVRAIAGVLPTPESDTSEPLPRSASAVTIAAPSTR